ncbi:MAG TPA: hypothetical protein VHH73_17615 [Verrucomicrobiae bacterium]|nr:hypothetical protein [Verrucomicrobiae bacterium]
MKTNRPCVIAVAFATLALFSALSGRLAAQTLLNIDFGGSPGAKTGFAATGQSSNDFWNAYTHYRPRFSPGMTPVGDGRMEGLKLGDGGESGVAITVTNAPGVWGNSTGDAMFDSYMFASNGSNLLVRLTGLAPGRYHFFLYGRADADATPEQNSVFELAVGTNHFGPLAASGAAGWRSPQSWTERAQYVVFRDVAVEKGEAVNIEVQPGPGGVAVLNGIQILSRGTSPPRLVGGGPVSASVGPTNILFSLVHYDGRLSTNDARFAVQLEAESRATNEISALLFEGDVALLSPKLPAGWRIVNRGRQFFLFAQRPEAIALSSSWTRRSR